MPTIGQLSPTLFRRGSRMLPAYPDLRVPYMRRFGSAAVQADDATAAAAAGQVFTGVAAVQAQSASVRAVSEQGTRWPSGPSFMLIRRPGRLWLVDDQRVFVNVAVGTKTGVAAAVAGAASASVTAERIVVGTATPSASAATVVAESAYSSGPASVFASDATVAASGEITANAFAVVTAGPALVLAVGARVVTVTGAPQSQAASTFGLGGISGTSVGALVAQAGDATVAATAARSFQGTAAATAGNASVSVDAAVIAPLAPVFDSIPMILSRQWRYTTLDMTRYLLQGDEPVTWQVVSGALPTGLSLDSITGLVSGTPTTIATYNLIIRVTNISGVAQTDEFQWVISDSIPRNGLLVNQNVVTIAGI